MPAENHHEDFVIRPFQSTDLPAVKRIWRECGWIEQESDEIYVEDFYAHGRGFSATLDGVTECVGQYAAGEMQYQDESLSMAAVTAIVTSAIARRRGLAKTITAKVVSDAAQQGADIAVLGIFEQGFYDLLGFGSGPYEHLMAFDPSNINCRDGHRIPRRLDKNDWNAIHRSLQKRWLSHAGCTLDDASHTKACLGWRHNGWGLGYFDDEGELTHFFYGKLDDEHGPLQIYRLSYQNGAQLRELLSLIKSLGDQVSQVKFIEPPHISMQDFLIQPFRFWRLSKSSKHESSLEAAAFWQARILNLEACLQKTRTVGPPLEFNLELTDPIRPLLDADSKWTGIAGEYVVRFSEESSAKKGQDPELPTLRASAGAFTRLWMGVRPATELAVSDELLGGTDLLEALDEALRLPQPKLGWYF